MLARTPAVAGQFYPSGAEQCRALIQSCLAEAEAVELAVLPAGTQLSGGIVPHAGWVCSGAVAGLVVRELARDEKIETFVVFGAVHRRLSLAAAAFGAGEWETPVGNVALDDELALASAAALPLIKIEPDAHEDEHSIEVEVPFIRHLAPQARLMPVMVPPSVNAPLVGRAVAETAKRMGRRAVFLGSTDLTHYGPRYRFAPRGVGPEGLQWAKDVNDRRILQLIVGLREEEVVPEATEHRNACGAGAVAATLAACRMAGANAGYVLRHTNSNEVLRSRYGELDDAVGYAGVVLGREAHAAADNRTETPGVQRLTRRSDD